MFQFSCDIPESFDFRYTFKGVFPTVPKLSSSLDFILQLVVAAAFVVFNAVPYVISSLSFACVELVYKRAPNCATFSGNTTSPSKK